MFYSCVLGDTEATRPHASAICAWNPGVGGGQSLTDFAGSDVTDHDEHLLFTQRFSDRGARGEV